MNFLSRLFARPEEKVSRGFQMHMYDQPAAEWSGRNFSAFSREAYIQNVIAAQAIQKLAAAISSIQWQATQGGSVVANHPMLALLRQPNPKQSGIEFWREKITYLYLAGDSFDERVVNGNRVLELWTLRPDRMKVVPSKTGLPSRYEYTVAGRSVPFPSDPVTGESDILHTQFVHPTNDWLGLSPINAGAYSIDIHNEAQTWIKSLLQNSARPSGALVAPESMSLSDEQFSRLKREISETYAGARNAGRPMVIEGGLKWETLGLSPDEMTFIDVKDSAARDISLAFGVPPLLLGIPGDNTYSNYREARIGFYEDTVIPLAQFLIASFNKWMAPYLNGAEIEPDIDAIPAVADKRRELWSMIDKSDEITVNEARALKNLPPLADAAIGTMLMADLRASRRGHTDGKEAPDDAGAQNDPV